MTSFPSISQINKAGRLIRLGGGTPAEREIAAAVADQFRSAHQLPTIKANNGLRSFARTAGCEAKVTQRLKERRSIVEKLRRTPNSPLARLEDIGGCRAVVHTLDELRRLEERLVRARPPHRYRDYVEHPQASGYRAVHVIVGYVDALGMTRRVEIQLRTVGMNLWADSLVEYLGRRARVDLKHGEGPAETHAALAELSQLIADMEVGRVPVGEASEERIRTIIREAVRYL